MHHFVSRLTKFVKSTNSVTTIMTCVLLFLPLVGVVAWVPAKKTARSDQGQRTKPGTPVAGSEARSTKAEKAFGALISKAEDKGSVRVIGLNIPFKPEGTLASQRQVKSQHINIARTQDDLLRSLSAFDVRAVKKFTFIPYMAFIVDADGLKRLRESPSVSSIHEDVPVPPLLADSVSLIGTPNAWASGYTGKGQTIAILDSGVSSGHPFLGDKMVSEACYSTPQENVSKSFCTDEVPELTGPGSGAPCDLSIEACRHGTHVAGIAAGTNSDFSGVAKGANLISIQVFSRFDNQEDCGDPEENPAPCILSCPSDQIRGLERVQELGGEFSIAAVNISIGGGKYDSQATCDAEQAPMKTAIDNLKSLGIATVIASGNDGYSDGLSSPGCISTAISVGSTDDGSEKTTSDVVSIFDPTHGSNSADFLNLLAPGRWIKSSVPGGGFSSFQGTSMAAPHVAGAWAILKSKAPSASVNDVLAALSDTGVPVTDPRNNIHKPRIKIDAALNALGSPHLPPNSPSSLGQSKIYADEGLPEGGDTTESAIRFKAFISDPNGKPIKLQVELVPASEPFRGIPTIESGLAATTNVTLTKLGIAFGDYKWACRAMNADGLASPWVEFGAAGNTDFSRIRIPNDYFKVEQIQKREENGIPYIYVRWTLLRKWDEGAVAVYLSLNDNLPSMTRSSAFEPLLMGGHIISYFDTFRSLGMSLEQGHHMWKPVGSPCNNARHGSPEYTVGNQYTTRFPRVLDMSTFSWVDAANITSTSNIRFTIYDRTHSDASPCNMDFKEAFPDSTDYHVQQNANLNHPANNPATVNQVKIFADESLPEGGNTTESAIRFRATVSDPDGDTVKLQIELRHVSDPFTGVPTIESGLVDSGAHVIITQTGVAFGDYKWAYRAMDASGHASQWTEFVTGGNRDFSRAHITNDYVRVDEVLRREDGGTQYLYVRWTLLRKWNDASVAVYPSLNGNLPSMGFTSGFESLFMGGNSFTYFDGFRSLGMSLDQGHYMWKPVGGMCNNAGPGPAEYLVGNQYTTRFPSVFDMATFSWVNAADVAPATNIRFTIYDRTQFNASQCNMDHKEAFPDSTNYHAQLPTPTPTPTVIPGQVIISEFRFRGQNGSNDEFIELYNTTGSDITVGTTDGSGGWALSAFEAGALQPLTKSIIPAGAVIPAYGHYLVTNSNTSGGPYSLDASAAGDRTYSSDIADNAGVALFRTANPNNFSLDTRLDAVGFDSTPDTLWREGIGLLPAGGITANLQFSFVRRMTSGVPQDTGDNTQDFVLVSTTGSLVDGVQFVLGAPGPENRLSPIQRNALIKASLIDPGCSGGGSLMSTCARVRTAAGANPQNAAFGTLLIRRKFRNTTGVGVSQLRFRVVNITTLGNRQSGEADLRLLSSTDLDVTDSNGNPAFIEGVMLEENPQAQPNGGMNSSVRLGRITMAAPLAPGNAVNIQFRLGVMAEGNFRFLINVEASPIQASTTENQRNLKTNSIKRKLRIKSP